MKRGCALTTLHARTMNLLANNTCLYNIIENIRQSKEPLTGETEQENVSLQALQQ